MYEQNSKQNIIEKVTCYLAPHTNLFIIYTLSSLFEQ